MINELINMNGYGIYVWSAFIFTLLNFILLYAVIKIQYAKRKKVYDEVWISYIRKASFAKSQSINREILSNISNI